MNSVFEVVWNFNFNLKIWCFERDKSNNERIAELLLKLFDEGAAKTTYF